MLRLTRPSGATVYVVPGHVMMISRSEEGVTTLLLPSRMKLAVSETCEEVAQAVVASGRPREQLADKRATPKEIAESVAEQKAKES